MSEKVVADADELRRVGKLFERPIAILESALKTFAAEIQPGDPPVWGTDKNGQDFGQRYQPTADKTVEVWTEVVTKLGDIKNNFYNMATVYEATEEANSK